MADLIRWLDCPCDGCKANPCGHPAKCVKFALWLNKTVDAVEVPCKIGDEVWAIRNYKGIKHPQKGFVSDMFFTRDMKLHIVVKHIARGEWGKDVFATYEEAAEAIGERKDNETY